MIKVLFVCLGNICRSPAAEAVLRALVREHGLADQIAVDSAGTSQMQVGKAPDPRAQTVGACRGLDLSALRARQIQRDECARHDYILVMDGANLDDVRALCPLAQPGRVHRFLEFVNHPAQLDVPDPYLTSGLEPFEAMFDLIETGCRGLLRRLISLHPDELRPVRPVEGATVTSARGA